LRDGLNPLITCEHGGNRIPAKYRSFFSGHEALLATHRGWDPGALALARTLAKALGAPLRKSTVSRLLVELNRSLHHPSLFSPMSRVIPREARDEILEKEYHPYRNGVADFVAAGERDGLCTLHLSIHTFTPELDGAVRSLEMGILYDPARDDERAFAREWRSDLRARIREARAGIRIRFNQPYRGTSDGLTSWLRRDFPQESYLGIEVEVNQGLIRQGGPRWRTLRDALVTSLRGLLDG